MSQTNNDKIILDLCGGTGSWSKPYKEAGYDVRLITLPDNDVLTYEPPKNVYGILAAPPCTEFSCAKADNPRDLSGAMQVVEACLKIIWKCQLNQKLTFWAMENPRGLLRQFLGVPPMTFEHWQFGDDGIKPTDLWGYYNKPTLKVKEKPCNLTKRFPNGKTNGNNWGTPKAPEWCKDMKLDRAAIRAITPVGFSQAFYEANK